MSEKKYDYFEFFGQLVRQEADKPATAIVDFYKDGEWVQDLERKIVQ